MPRRKRMPGDPKTIPLTTIDPSLMAWQKDAESVVTAPTIRRNATADEQLEAMRIVARLEQMDAAALRIYEPLPQQVSAHSSPAKERVFWGGNRCLAGDTMIWDPAAMISRRVDQIDEPFHVTSVDPATGCCVVATANIPWLKGEDDLYRVTLSNGLSFTATLAHTLLCDDGEWRSIASLSRSLPLSSHAPLRSSWDTSRRAFARDVPHSTGTVVNTQAEQRFAGRLESHNTTQQLWPDQVREPVTWGSLQCGELNPPVVAALEYVGKGRFYDFRVPTYHNYVLAGVIHHNSAKTATAVFETGRAVAGCHPVLSGKSWGLPKENGRAMFVGKTLSHIGRVMYPKLFLPGAIRMIRDPETNRWRNFRPWQKWDAENENLAKPAPPIIPPEMIVPRGTAWLKARENIPKRVLLKNGWEIYFFSSEGDPPRGDDYNWAWFDEEMLSPQWYPETAMRLITRSGYFIWSATGQDGGEEMYEVYQRAEAQRGEKNPRCAAFFFNPEENPYFPRQELELAKDKLKNRPDEYRARILGEFLNAGFRVYPEFRLDVHGFDLNTLEHSQVPDNWARWAVIDPGSQVCAVLFVAVPPNGSMILAYDELYIRSCTAQKLAEALRHKMGTQRFEAILIDVHGASVHEMSSGKTREQHYHDAMASLGLWTNVRRKGFFYGASDVHGGIESVHNLLYVEGESGTPMFRVARERCENLEAEFARYCYKRNARDKMPSNDPDNRHHNHLMDCLRYIAMYRPRYRKPEAAKKPRSPGATMYEQIMGKGRKKSPITFAPGSGRAADSLSATP